MIGDEVPSYEDVSIDERLEEAREFLDKREIDNGGDEETVIPESFEVAAHKYNIQADISPRQKEQFDVNRAFFGTHVVNSNTMRKDNFRHLMQMDLCDTYISIPSRRRRGTQIRQRVTAEYQACRSNPEIGGFDRKLQRTILKREDIDLKQLQTLNSGQRKRKGILNFLHRKKGE